LITPLAATPRFQFTRLDSYTAANIKHANAIYTFE
jgi:hypothetical protein